MATHKWKLIPNPFDQYTFTAQYVPAIIAAIPAMILLSLVEAQQLQELFKHAGWFLIVRDVSLSTIAVIAFTHAVRLMGKYGIELSLFQNGLRFPTTEMLLWKTRLLSAERKRQLHAQIKADFGIQLCTEAEEALDEQEARLRAKDAVGQVRIKVGAGIRTRQYNIQYGLSRNLAGGTPLMLILAVFAVIFVPGGLAKALSLGCIAFSILYGVACLPLLRHMGSHYAEYLFNEYLRKENANE